MYEKDVPDQFRQDVKACVEALNILIKSMITIFGPTVCINALALHFASALHQHKKHGIIPDDFIDEIIDRVTHIAKNGPDVQH